MNERYEFPDASRLTETNLWVLWWRENRPKKILMLSDHSGRDVYLSRLNRQTDFFAGNGWLEKIYDCFSASFKSS